MDRFGYIEGVRMFLVVSFLTTILVTYARWKVLKEILGDEETNDTNEKKLRRLHVRVGENKSNQASSFLEASGRWSLSRYSAALG
ncbi:MAG: hypothetical protein NWE89_02565 [Candidatus Bathyarchaeota archaeon]|nr:hypothetical protein [Candidatus Bathyarchaeota archaeon]